jgi:pantothenate kinase
MGLREKVRLRLESKGFDKLYEQNAEAWTELCNSARAVIQPEIANKQPTVDDIKDILQPLIELHALYRKFMENHPRLTQRYWPSDFTDLVLHKVYQPTLNVD